MTENPIELFKSYADSKLPQYEELGYPQPPYSMGYEGKIPVVMVNPKLWKLFSEHKKEIILKGVEENKLILTIQGFLKEDI